MGGGRRLGKEQWGGGGVGVGTGQAGRGADQWNDNEGRGGGESDNVGPDTRHVQDAHAP